MTRIVVYQKPTCSTCRKVYTILKEKGVDFKLVDYYVELLSKNKIKNLLVKMGISAAELIRTKEIIYKELKINEKSFSEDQLIEFMVKYPGLIQRPILEIGKRAVLARPVERIFEIL